MPGNRTSDWYYGKVLRFEPQLPADLREGGAAGPRRHIVGHGVQADVELVAAQRVVRVQSAGRVVALQHKHLPLEVGQADGGSQARHARADDDDVVVRRSHDKGALYRQAVEKLYACHCEEQCDEAVPGEIASLRSQ